MDKIEPDNRKRNRLLVYTFDAMIVNACCITAIHTYCNGVNWMWGLLLLNNAALIVLRQWISGILHIHWLESPLNRFLKRLTDTSLSLLFLLTAFPIIFVIQAIVTRRSNRGSILAFRKINIGDKKQVSGMVFRTPMFADNRHFGRLPLAFNTLLGSISLWDIPLVEDTADCTEDMPDQTESIKDNTVDNADDYDDENSTASILTQHDDDSETQHDKYDKPSETDDWV